MTAYSTVDTPAGPFTTIVDSDGVVLASGWTTAVDELVSGISPGLRPDELEESADLGAVTDAVRAFHAGDRHAVEDIEVRQRGGAFIEQVWKVLRTVPAGKQVSYAELADLAGRPSAVRAAASACARNPAALFVPCHRVVRTGGGLGGFRWGPDVKEWLLRHETG